MQGSIPFLVLHNGIKLFLQQAFDTLFMTIACCIMQTSPACNRSHACKSGHLRNKIGSKPNSPSPSTALDSDGLFSIAASSLSIMPSFAIAAGATSMVTVFAELMTSHCVRPYWVPSGTSDATLSAFNRVEPIALMRRFKRFFSKVLLVMYKLYMLLAHGSHGIY